MKVTKSYLRQIIKEEVSEFLREDEEYYHISDASYNGTSWTEVNDLTT